MTGQGSTSWLDRPDVLAVTFHPRAEFGGLGASSEYESLDIPVDDGVTLGARFYGAGQDKVTLLFFHGNGEIVADYGDIAGQFVAVGVNFFPVDYRGYGRSTGRPTVSSMLADARTAFRFARQWLADRDYTQPIVVMGRSLGSACALEIASAYPDQVAGLIIESGFSDTVGLLQRLGARLPKKVPENEALSQTDKMGTYHGPTLVIHGTQDWIIPPTDADALFAACPSAEKRLLKIEGAGHNDILFVGMREYMAAVQELVNTCQDKDRP